MPYAIRYKPGTDLARRFPNPSHPFKTRETAEAVRHYCINAEHMETVEVED